MTTRDGVSSEDWDKVHELAVALVNSNGSEHDRLRHELLRWLDALEKKYGPLASILDTQADYSDDPLVAERLRQRAYDIAHAQDDHENLLLVAQSLVELYVERQDVDSARLWLDRALEHLQTAPDPFVEEELKLLREQLDQLAG